MFAARSVTKQLLSTSAATARAMSTTKVTVLGAAGGIGQSLSMLLKLSPEIDELACYDIVGTPGVAADLSHVSSCLFVRACVAWSEGPRRDKSKGSKKIRVSRLEDTLLRSRRRKLCKLRRVIGRFSFSLGFLSALSPCILLSLCSSRLLLMYVVTSWSDSLLFRFCPFSFLTLAIRQSIMPNGYCHAANNNRSPPEPPLRVTYPLLVRGLPDPTKALVKP